MIKFGLALTLGSVAFAIVLLACTGGSTANQPTNVVASNSNPVAVDQNVNLQNLYDDTCAKCHGNRGQGGGGGTKTFNTIAKFDQKNDKPYFDAVKNGVSDMGMESYGQTMSDEVIWGLVVYIRELQAKALRAEKGPFRPNSTGAYHTNLHDYKVETTVDTDQGLKTPWAVEWLPDGKMLVTNRPGPISVVEGGKVISQIQGLPEVVELGQGGMMEITLHPDYAKNGWIYLGYTEPGGRGGMTKFVRGKLRWSGNQATWHSQQTIFEVDKKFYTGAGIHFGTRVVFDGKGHIFLVVGERGGNMLAQQLDNPFGKIYRLNEDGTIPADNPFAKDGAKTPVIPGGIWTYGHRNPQGLAFDASGQLWDTEHGPRGGDEVNLITKGTNYGWPVVAYSMNYSGSPFKTPWPKNGEKFGVPVFRWMPSIGACGLDLLRGDKYPRWKDNLLAGGLSGANVDRFKMKGSLMVEREEILHGMGRVRDVAVGPDGLIYVTLNDPDKVIRLVPVR